MTERTRREFLETAAAAAAVTVVTPTALARAQSPVAPGQSPAPVGPGAAYVSYQSEIYVAGMSADVKPIFTTNLSDLEAVAAKVLSEDARRNLLEWAGGPGAVRANAKALDTWRIVPRMFIDRAKRDLSATVLGDAMPAPVILGPVGNQRSAHPDGEVAVARVAADLGLTYVHASQASTSPDDVRAAAPTGSHWFALDWPDETGPDLAPLGPARSAGFTHLLLSAPPAGRNWTALTAVRNAWGGPVIVSGIQTVTDARTAVAQRVDGIVVSSERGRRGAKPTGTIDALPRVVDAVGGKVPVLFGSGVLTGTDVYRALALGADAVIIGRPYVHGLALGGEAGVRHVLRTLLAELDITLAIAGVKSYRELSRGSLVRT